MIRGIGIKGPSTLGEVICINYNAANELIVKNNDAGSVIPKGDALYRKREDRKTD